MTPILGHRPDQGSAPKKVYLASQRKYDIDPGSPWWKRLLFWRVFMPFNRFFFRPTFKFQVPDHRDQNGEPNWLEHEGVFLDEWQAELEAAKYPFGVVIELRFNESLPAESFQPPQAFPNSTAKLYERIGTDRIHFDQADVDRLKSKIAETDGLVQCFRANTT